MLIFTVQSVFSSFAALSREGNKHSSQVSLQNVCVNLQSLRVWPLEPTLLPGLAVHLQQNPAASLLLMRAGGMYQPFSCFLFSLSLSHVSFLRCSQAVLNISSLILSSSLPSISSCSSLIYSGVPPPMRPGRIDCQTVSLFNSVQREANEQLLPHFFTCANQRAATLLSPGTFIDDLIQFHDS